MEKTKRMTVEEEIKSTGQISLTEDEAKALNAMRAGKTKNPVWKKVLKIVAVVAIIWFLMNLLLGFLFVGKASTLPTPQAPQQAEVSKPSGSGLSEEKKAEKEEIESQIKKIQEKNKKDAQAIEAEYQEKSKEIEEFTSDFQEKFEEIQENFDSYTVSDEGTNELYEAVDEAFADMDEAPIQ